MFYFFFWHANIFINNQNTVSGRTVEEDNLRGRLCPATLYLLFLLPLWVLWILFSVFCLNPCFYCARSCKVRTFYTSHLSFFSRYLWFSFFLPLTLFILFPLAVFIRCVGEEILHRRWRGRRITAKRTHGKRTPNRKSKLAWLHSISAFWRHQHQWGSRRVAPALYLYCLCNVINKVWRKWKGFGEEERGRGFFACRTQWKIGQLWPACAHRDI